jgi:NAD-dependent deacetylase
MAFDAQHFRNARHVVVFTGAGISAESGVPTFRDALSGLWERFDPAELATPRAFRKDPALVWGWYEWRRSKVMHAHPNAAHLAIAELARHVPNLTVVTQNVDDLHERGGSHNIVHLHGSLNTPRCFACARPYTLSTGMLDEPEAGRCLEPPRCLRCNRKIRPGVAWFGESLPEAAWRAAIAAVSECDLLLSVGTSGVVQPAATIPQMALERGAIVLHVNVQPTQTQHEREFSVAGPAAKVLPELLHEAFG